MFFFPANQQSRKVGTGAGGADTIKALRDKLLPVIAYAKAVFPSPAFPLLSLLKQTR